MTDMLTLDGTTQPISEWALDYGIYPNVITDRLARGWPVDRAITTPMMVAPRQRLISHRRLPGSSRSTRTKRPKSTGPKRTGKQLTHNGRCLSIVEWSELLGVTAPTIYRRIRLGWPVELVLTADRLSGRCRAGVGKNLPALVGTGGGPIAQDISEIEFSQ